MARNSTRPTFEISLAHGKSPLRHRICDALLSRIADGSIHPGDQMPSTRILAETLGVSRGVVVAAYDELLAAGYFLARPGAATHVAPGADRAVRAGAITHPTPERRKKPARGNRDPQYKWDLQPGKPDSSLINRSDWMRAWRTAAAGAIGVEPPKSHGHIDLRVALSDYLRRSRGVNYAPDDLFILPGVAAAVSVIGQAIGINRRTVAVEDPGYAHAHRALADCGARLHPADVDEQGIVPSSIGRAAILAYTTPANQYPLGSRLSVERRAELIAWARSGGKTVIEDDYDGEFRYDVSPMPALASLEGATAVVAYIGTASKILTPSMRLAWLAPPPHLAASVRDIIDSTAIDVCATTSGALAHFISSGALARHLARAARTYSARRTAFLAALRTQNPGLELRGIEAGLHVMIPLPDASDENAIVEALGRRGVGVRGLSSYLISQRSTRGLICGYARLPESHAAAAAQEICDVLEKYDA